MVAIGSTIACGKKGPPLPPLRPVPSMVGELSANGTGTTVAIHFSAPAGNTDGTMPPAAERIDVYALTLLAAAPPPAIEQLAVASNVVTTVRVRPNEAAAPSEAITAIGPGDPVTFTDRVSLPADGGPFVRYYAVAAWAGRRRGVLSPLLSVPLGSGPPPPSALATKYDEATLTLSWQASGAAQRFVVDRLSGAADSVRLTREPLAATEISTPVQLGAEMCFVVRTVEMIGAVTLTGQPARGRA